jgi:flavin reductase (DIM6/NTAB) family NADH-FMN oxidoreductase RutF
MPNYHDKTSLSPATLLSPVPTVLVSCRRSSDPAEKPNLITIAWAGTVCSDPPMVSISVRKERYSHPVIIESGEFVINLVNEKLLWAADYCGVKSGSIVDKFAECHLTAIEASGMDHTPAVAESPVALSCKVRQVHDLGSHDCIIAEIVAVTADTSLIDKNNRLRLDKAGLVAYCHGEYMQLGSVLGFYGFSVAKPDVLARRMPSGKPGNLKK